MRKFVSSFVTSLLVFFQLSLIPISKKNERTPPGTLFVKEIGYYVDKDVVTVSEWKEFYWHTKKVYGDSVAAHCLPDNKIQIAYYGKNIMTLNKNNKTNDIENLPIVGVSPTQIEKYCLYRTKKVSEFKKFEGIKFTYHPIDSVIYTRLLQIEKIKRLTNISSNIPELVNYYDFSSSGEKWQIIENKDKLVKYSKFKKPYGFRCFVVYYKKKAIFGR